MNSIKDKVAIIGAGCTRFGERWDQGYDDMVIDATREALDDAGSELNDILAKVVEKKLVPVEIPE